MWGKKTKERERKRNTLRFIAPKNYNYKLMDKAIKLKDIINLFKLTLKYFHPYIIA